MSLKRVLPDEVTFEAVHCALTIRRPAPGVVIAIFKGMDVGEFGTRPFEELQKDLATGQPLELFIDARDVPGASIDVSKDWAKWMQENRSQLHRLSILCSSPFVQMTARFIRGFTGFEERMRIYTEAATFESAIAAAVG